MAPSKGRPPIQNPKNQRLALRVTASEKSEIQNFMRENNCSLLELIQTGMEAVKKTTDSGETLTK